MAAALITAVTRKEITGLLGMEVLRVYVTTTGDWVCSRFGNIVAVVVSDETTTGGAKATWSGQKITITATGGDYVTLVVFGS